MSDADDWTAMPIGEPARRALRNVGLTRVAQLGTVSRDDVAALHGMGLKALAALTAAMLEQGVEFS